MLQQIMSILPDAKVAEKGECIDLIYEHSMPISTLKFFCEVERIDGYELFKIIVEIDNVLYCWEKDYEKFDVFYNKIPNDNKGKIKEPEKVTFCFEIF